MPLGEVTTALILAWQLHSIAFVTMLSDSKHAGNLSKQNTWQAFNIVLASAAQ